MNKADKNKADAAALAAAQRAALRFLWSYIRPDIRFVAKQNKLIKPYWKYRQEV